MRASFSVWVSYLKLNIQSICCSSFVKYLPGGFWSISRHLDLQITLKRGCRHKFACTLFAEFIHSTRNCEGAWIQTQLFQDVNFVSSESWMRAIVISVTTTSCQDSVALHCHGGKKQKAKHMQLVFTFHFLNTSLCAFESTCVTSVLVLFRGHCAVNVIKLFLEYLSKHFCHQSDFLFCG